VQVVCVLAVLKCGAAYLPLDLSYPVDRLQFMLQDSAVACVLTSNAIRESSELFRDCHAPTFAVADEWSHDVEPYFGKPLEPCRIDPGASAYVIYTSGSLERDEFHILDGACFVNNVVMSNQIKGIVAVVAQEDIVMGKETPKDAFNFACRVRLGLDSDAASLRTAETLDALYLTKCSDTLLGIPGIIKGVSGGETNKHWKRADLQPCDYAFG